MGFKIIVFVCKFLAIKVGLWGAVAAIFSPFGIYFDSAGFVHENPQRPILRRTKPSDAQYKNKRYTTQARRCQKGFVAQRCSFL